MAETSMPWGGTIVGDAGPYTDDHWTDIWQYFLGALAQADTGILSNILNELIVTGAADPVSVATGVALVNGTFYINDDVEAVPVPIPVGAQRIDRIVLRKDWTAQTVRIHRLVGIEGGGAPVLTQDDSNLWDIPLFEATVAFPGGAITLVDERERLNTRIPSMTIAERNIMTAINGMLIHNEDINLPEARADGSWLALAGLTAILKPPVVRWVMPGWWSHGSSDGVVTAGRIYYAPIFVPKPTTYDRIGIYCRVGDGAGGLADLRIFEWDNGVPGALVLSAGTVNTNANGAKEIVINQELYGLYFLAVRVDQTPTLSGVAGTSSTFVSATAPTNAQGGPHYVVLYDDAAYADPAGAVDGGERMSFAIVKLRES